MSQTDDHGQRLCSPLRGKRGGGDFPISPIDEVGRTRRVCVRALARFHNAVNSRARGEGGGRLEQFRTATVWPTE